jgi:hypothetical protein
MQGVVAFAGVFGVVGVVAGGLRWRAYPVVTALLLALLATGLLALGLPSLPALVFAGLALFLGGGALLGWMIGGLLGLAVRIILHHVTAPAPPIADRLA